MQRLSVSSSTKRTDALHNILECFQLHEKINQPGLLKKKKMNVYTNCVISALLSWHISTPHLKSARLCMWVDLHFTVSSSCPIDTCVEEEEGWLRIPQFSF